MVKNSFFYDFICNPLTPHYSFFHVFIHLYLSVSHFPFSRILPYFPVTFKTSPIFMVYNTTYVINPQTIVVILAFPLSFCLKLSAHLTPGIDPGTSNSLYPMLHTSTPLLQIYSCVFYLSHEFHHHPSHPIHKTPCHRLLLSFPHIQ